MMKEKNENKKLSKVEYARDLMLDIVARFKDKNPTYTTIPCSITDKEYERLYKKYGIEKIDDALCGQSIEDKNGNVIANIMLLKQGDVLTLVIKKGTRDTIVVISDEYTAVVMSNKYKIRIAAETIETVVSQKM